MNLNTAVQVCEYELGFRYIIMNLDSGDKYKF